MMVVAYLYAKKNNVPVIKEKKSPKEVLHICLDSMWALIMPVIILGGIYSGIFTPTEAAGRGEPLPRETIRWEVLCFPFVFLSDFSLEMTSLSLESDESVTEKSLECKGNVLLYG